MDDRKESGCQKYNKQFKNKGKERTRHGKHARVGNTHSISHSRPEVPIQRVLTNMDNNDIVNYKADDRRVPDHKNDRKTYARGLVSYDQTLKMNQQIGNKVNPKIPSLPTPKVVNLHKIKPNLYLANCDWVYENIYSFCDQRKTFVIDLSDAPHTFYRQASRYVLKYYHFDLSKMCNYKRFEKLMLPILDLIQSIPDIHNIVVTCNKGVNRSVSTIACSAMMLKDMSYDECMEYICTEKEKVDPFWVSMTNNSYKNYVRAFGTKYRGNAKIIPRFVAPPSCRVVEFKEVWPYQDRQQEAEVYLRQTLGAELYELTAELYELTELLSSF